MAGKVRQIPLLQLLQQRYSEEDKKNLFAWILCGEIRVNQEGIRDPKRLVPIDSQIEHSGGTYVSRGGAKLASVFPQLMSEYPALDPSGSVVLDAGASTGGFTDYLLQSGAELVYSLDVGYNQLDYRLRIDPKVRVLERQNVLALNDLKAHGIFSPLPRFCTADLSFRSIQGAALAMLQLCTEKLVLALIKPQFERRYSLRNWSGQVEDLDLGDDFDGIVPPNEIPHILQDVKQRLAAEGVQVLQTLPSGVKGAKGNSEYFFLMTLAGEDQA